MEASTGTLNLRQKFDPYDLELIDRVYGVACAYIQARDLYRDTEKDAEDACRVSVEWLLTGIGPTRSR
jgi:hypothetical protein